MTISYVSSAANAGTSITLPTHQAGDLIVFFVRYSTVGIPLPLSGWFRAAALNASGNSMQVAYKTAASNAETSGTWTNAKQILAITYRHTTAYLQLGLSTQTNATTATTITYPANATVADSTWFIGFGSCISGTTPDVDTNFDLAPSGMTNRVSQWTVSTGEMTIHDTNSNVASWSSTNRTNDTSIRYNNFVIPILVGATKSTGGFRPVNIRGGADQ